MTKQPHIHYHTDCDFFAGCENMMANFLNDEMIHREFAVSFSYRWSKRYQTGLRQRVGEAMTAECYPIVAGNVFTLWGAKKGRVIKTLVRALNYVLLVRYWIILWNMLVLCRAWHGRGIDVLHINNGGYPAALSCLSAAIAARLVGIRNVVMVVNNIAHQGRYWYWWLDRPLDYLVGRCVTRFVTGSSNAGGVLQSVLKLPGKKFTTLHNGIAVRETSETMAQTRARLGLEQGTMVFGMVALLEWRKGHRVLFNAVAELRDMIPAERMPMFLIEGEGPERVALDDMVARLGIGKWVWFVGAERLIFNFVHALDVMLLPSVANEDFPNVVLEAMSLGKPVIASRIAGTPEQIDDGVTGSLVAPGDATALALKIASFVQDRARVAMMGARARDRFEREFTAKVAVSRYIDLYQELLNGRNN